MSVCVCVCTHTHVYVSVYAIFVSTGNSYCTCIASPVVRFSCLTTIHFWKRWLLDKHVWSIFCADSHTWILDNYSKWHVKRMGMIVVSLWKGLFWNTTIRIITSLIQILLYVYTTLQCTNIILCWFLNTVCSKCDGSAASITGQGAIYKTILNYCHASMYDIMVHLIIYFILCILDSITQSKTVAFIHYCGSHLVS